MQLGIPFHWPIFRIILSEMFHSAYGGGMIVNNIHVLRYHADPDYINSILAFGAAFAEWEDLNYWHETKLIVTHK